MSDTNLIRLVAKNLLFTIQTVVGSDLFRHIYVRDQAGKEFDAVEDGKLSCALVVSGILALHGLIDHPHATVETTLKTMQAAGWKSTTHPQPGDVVHWPSGQNGHQHLGFYIRQDQFMSNSAEQRQPIIHGQALDDGRLPDAYYTHDMLSKS